MKRKIVLTAALLAGAVAAVLTRFYIAAKDADGGDYSANFALTVKNGRLALSNSKPLGTTIILW